MEKVNTYETMNRLMKTHGIPARDAFVWGTVYHLERTLGRECRQNDIARELSYSPGCALRSVRSLVKVGLLSRVDLRPDKKVALFSLSAIVPKEAQE